METYVFPHMPPGLREVHLALFPSIPSGASLRERLISAASFPAGAKGDAAREEVNFAFIDASMVLSKAQVLTAVQQALIAAARGKAGGEEGVQGGMKSSNVHGEIIFALLPGNNIGESLRVFGVGPSTKNLLVIRVSDTTDASTRRSFLQQMTACAQVKASPLPIEHILNEIIADVQKIRKVYKLNDAVLPKEEQASREILNRLVVSSVAMKMVAG